MHYDYKKLLLCVSFFIVGCGSTADPIDIEEVASFEVLLNAYRVEINCPALQWSTDLAIVAQEHSIDMNQNNYLSHNSLDGSTPFDRMNHAGIGYTLAAENIAIGSSDPQTILDGWLNSPGHRANIENCDYTHHGVGYDGSSWTHMFMVPR